MDLLHGFYRFSWVSSILIDVHRFHPFLLIFIDFYCFLYISIALIDSNEYLWFLMDLQRFSKSKMLAKLIKRSFCQPRTPCTFRVVRLELTRVANGSAAWVL